MKVLEDAGAKPVLKIGESKLVGRCQSADALPAFAI
jgi:hypothetical protein